MPRPDRSDQRNARRLTVSFRIGLVFCAALVALMSKTLGPDPLVTVEQTISPPPEVTISALN